MTQIDLPANQKSGLVVVGEILSAVEDISFIRFGGDDVVRHRLVQRIVAAYGEYGERRQAAQTERGGRSDRGERGADESG